jgi:hypothetical protein
VMLVPQIVDMVTLVRKDTVSSLVSQARHVLCEMLADRYSNFQIFKAAESPHVEPGTPSMLGTQLQSSGSTGSAGLK